MYLVTTSLVYNAREENNEAVEELGQVLGIDKLESYTPITVTEKEYFKYSDILDRVISKREIPCELYL